MKEASKFRYRSMEVRPPAMAWIPSSAAELVVLVASSIGELFANSSGAGRGNTAICSLLQ